VAVRPGLRVGVACTRIELEVAAMHLFLVLGLVNTQVKCGTATGIRIDITG